MNFINDIDRILEQFGYKTYNNYLTGNKAYNECKNMLWNITDKCSYSKGEEMANEKKIKISSLKEDVKRKSAILLKNVDLAAKYMNVIAFQIYANYDYSILEGKAKTINIFDIPVKYDSFSKVIYYAGVDTNSMIFPAIIVRKILLKSFYKYSSFILERNYIYELGHILNLRKKGTTDNYLHKEFVPISLALLYSYINSGGSELNKAVAERLNLTHSMMVEGYTSRDEATVNNSYLISSLLSFQMLEKYMEFGSKQKEEMQDRLKDCLNGNISVETFMEDYDIGFNNEDKSKRYLKRTIERIR